jgi:dolichol-phosphate mannosyltransferase
MVAQWEGGSRVVLAVRKERRGESRAKLWTAEMYYRLLSWIAESNTVRESGDFRLLDRTVVDAFNRLPERHRYIRGLIGWLGFRTSVVEYVRPERRAGETKYPVWKMVRLAMDGIVSLSFMPLRAAYLVALAMMVPFLGYLLYNAVLYYFYQVQMVPGWSSLLLAITLFGAANLLMLGILGEYAGRIYSEVKRRPIFLVEDSCGTVEGLHECR